MDVTELAKLGNQARNKAMAPEARSAQAQKASKARWAAYYKANPDKKRARKRKAGGK